MFSSWGTPLDWQNYEVNSDKGQNANNLRFLAIMRGNQSARLRGFSSMGWETSFLMLKTMLVISLRLRGRYL